MFGSRWSRSSTTPAPPAPKSYCYPCTTRPLSSSTRWCMGNATHAPPAVGKKSPATSIPKVEIVDFNLKTFACLHCTTIAPPSRGAPRAGGARVTGQCHHQAAESPAMPELAELMANSSNSSAGVGGVGGQLQQLQRRSWRSWWPTPATPALPELAELVANSSNSSVCRLNFHNPLQFLENWKKQP